jgi:aerobic C4-dicarboxylate transport protein
VSAINVMPKLFKSLYFQVLVAIAIGIALGYFYPSFAVELKPLGDGFIKLIKMMIAPIIFCTIVTGIAGMQNTKKVGRVGLKAILYFELVTTLALIIGLVVINVLRPGAGMNIDPAALDTKSVIF